VEDRISRLKDKIIADFSTETLKIKKGMEWALKQNNFKYWKKTISILGSSTQQNYHSK
jgi:hypothetical protein